MRLLPADRTDPRAVRGNMAVLPFFLRVPAGLMILIVGSMWVWLFHEVGADAPQPYAFVIDVGLVPFGYFMLVAGLFVLFPKAPFASAFLSRLRRVLLIAIVWVVVLTAAAIYLSTTSS